MIEGQFSTRDLRIWLERNYYQLMRLAIVAAVLAGSILLVPRFSMGYRSGRIVVLLLLGTGALILLLRHPPLGLVGLVVGSYLVPFTIGTSTGSPLNITVLVLALLLALWIGDMIARQRRLWLISSRPVLPLVLFAIVVILAFGLGQFRWYIYAQNASAFAQLGGLAIFLLSFGAVLLVGQQVQDLRWLQFLTWTFLVLGGVYVAGRAFSFLGDRVTHYFQSGITTNSLLWTWLAALSVSQFLFNRQLSLRWRFLAGLIALLTIYVGFFKARGWTSGWLPPMIAIGAILWVGAPRTRLYLLISAAGAALVKLSSVIGIVMIGDNQYSLMTRLAAWRIVAQIVKVNPILGLGPANYYWYTPLFPILGYYVQFNSHNNYVDIIAQTGLLGLVCFLWFAWEMGRLGWRLAKQVPEGFAKAYVFGAFGGLVGTMAAAMLGDWVLPFVYNVGLHGFRASAMAWVFLGGLLAVEQIYIRTKSPEKQK